MPDEWSGTGAGGRRRTVSFEGANAGSKRDKEPPEALLARAISRRLPNALAGRTAREIAELAGLSHQTVINVLDGATWWDAITIARLERALDTQLWGEEHRKRRTRPKRPSCAQAVRSLIRWPRR